MSSIGSRECSSQATKSASTTPAIANETSVVGLPQPFPGASMSPYTSATMPMIDGTAPIGSRLAGSGSRDFGTKNLPATSAIRITGTLIKNTEPNQKWPSSQPLASGPNAPAAPVTLAQMAIALGRSPGGKMLMMIESVDGMI